MAPTELRNFGKMAGPNDGTCTLVENIMSLGHRDVRRWRQIGLSGRLTGSIAVSFYGKPRYALSEAWHRIKSRCWLA